MLRPVMSARGYTVFDTPIGRCGIAWSERGVLAVQLPARRDADLRARLLERAPDARESEPPPAVGAAIEAICALLAGETTDLTTVALDFDGLPPFHRRVYETARMLPPGETRSYGDLARQLGAVGAARAVGQALARNPFPVVVPCHRVLAAGGRVGGFTSDGGIATKLRMLRIEAAARDRLDGAVPVLGFDPRTAVEHLRGADPVLARLIDAVGACRLQVRPVRSTFMALAEAIVYQQLNGRAAASIFARVCALFPQAHQGFTAEQLLRVSDARLRTAGLSGAKLLALRDLAWRDAAGTVPPLTALREMDDEAIVAQLSEVRGIGRWTVEMLLMFRLGRPDVLPVHDYGVRQGYAFAFGKRRLPPPAALERHARRWRPYRSAASWYLWRAVDLARAREDQPA
jgi:methylated-DNA-[protein]-cysteine S-methyltransferase